MAESKEIVDDNVIKRAATGERAAQRELYEYYYDRTYRLVRSIVGESAAEDVTQDCFMRVLANLTTFRFESRFSTWLHRLVVNESLQHVRRKSAIVGNSADFVENSVGQSDGIKAVDNAELLAVAMSRIEPELRVVFELKEVDQCSYAEIAEIVGIPEGTVGSRLNRARVALREQLTQLGWEA
jgi:RNA polymerase sigma-70 factor (ECF subfamily)